MTITLSPQAEEVLRSMAKAQSLSIEEVVERLVESQGHQSPRESASRPQARNLVELFADSPLRGSGIVIDRDDSPVRDVAL